VCVDKKILGYWVIISVYYYYYMCWGIWRCFKLRMKDVNVIWV